MMAPESTLSLIETAVITGGGGGIGRAMAEALIQAGKKVILVGRTEANLKSTASSIGAAGYYVLDTGDTAAIPGVVDRILADHPDVNCLVNNAGVQRPFQFPGVQEQRHQEYGFDLARADEEIDINIRGPMHLTLRFLPHLTTPRSKDKPGVGVGVVINVSSILGFLPLQVINPVYGGTKAWVHFFTMNLRSQYNNNNNPASSSSESSERLRVVEIVPPTVTTALHRDRTDPADNSKEKNKAAMSVQEFMHVVVAGFKDGSDIIAPGPAGQLVKVWYDALGPSYEAAVAGQK